MDWKANSLKLSGIWMFVGAALTLLTPIALVAAEEIGTVIGVILVLVFILLASYEFGAAKVAWKREMGGWGGVIKALLFAFLARLVLLYLADGFYLWTNALLAVGELGIFVMVYRSKDLFLPDEMEDAEIKKMSGPTVRSVAECPTCHEVVEVGWDSCPYCGTKLPVICGNCGTELGEMDSHCPECGTPVEGVEAVEQIIRSLRSALEDDEAPETRSGRLGKLGDAYLKKGDKEEALESYQQALEETQYTRKKTFFMVKKATVLKNMGREDQALDILDSALEIDPEDYAGAGQVKNGILSPSGEGDGERGTSA